MKALVVVDMQNDFIDGALGSKEAQAIVPNVVKKIENFEGKLILTKDTHNKDEYLSTLEGKLLPVPHCLVDNSKNRSEPLPGNDLNSEIEKAIENFRTRNDNWSNLEFVNKNTFGSMYLPETIVDLNVSEIEICGLCTDICVVSNALILRASFPNIPIKLDSSCCAGTTPENHAAALKVLKSCQIEVI